MGNDQVLLKTEPWRLTKEAALSWVTGGKSLHILTDAEVADARGRANILWGEVNKRSDSIEEAKELGLNFEDATDIFDSLRPGYLSILREVAAGMAPWQRKCSGWVQDNELGKTPFPERPQFDIETLEKLGDVLMTESGWIGVTSKGCAFIEEARSEVMFRYPLKLFAYAAKERDRLDYKLRLFESHKSAVVLALEQGLPVPSEVLADYPEIKSEVGMAA